MINIKKLHYYLFTIILSIILSIKVINTDLIMKIYMKILLISGKFDNSLIYSNQHTSLNYKNFKIILQLTISEKKDYFIISSFYFN